MATRYRWRLTMTFNPDDKPFCVFCGATFSAGHECDPAKLEEYVTREMAHLARMLAEVFPDQHPDPDYKHDAERNGDTPTRIERLIKDYI